MRETSACGGDGPQYAGPAPGAVDRETADARKLLAAVALPPGSVSTDAAPPGGNGYLSTEGAGGGEPCSYVPSFYEFYRSPSAFRVVLAWIAQHRPSRVQDQVVGSSVPPTFEADQLFWPNVPGVVQRSVLIRAIPLSGGGSGLRLETQVTTENPRPPDEVIPDGVASVKLTLGEDSQTVTDPSQIEQIISLSNALPAEQPPYGDAGSIGAQPPAVTVEFDSTDGSPLATMKPNYEVPGQAAFWIGDAQQPLLIGGDDYINQIEAVTGFNPGS